MLTPRALLGAGLVALTSATVAVAAVPANAAPAANPACPKLEVCVYKNIDEGGAWNTWIQGDVDVNFAQENYGHGGSSLNDSISSIVNNTNRTVYFYTDAYYKGSKLAVSSLASYNEMASTWNDHFSSMSSNGDLSK